MLRKDGITKETDLKKGLSVSWPFPERGDPAKKRKIRGPSWASEAARDAHRSLQTFRSFKSVLRAKLNLPLGLEKVQEEMQIHSLDLTDLCASQATDLF